MRIPFDSSLSRPLLGALPLCSAPGRRLFRRPGDRAGETASTRSGQATGSRGPCRRPKDFIKSMFLEFSELNRSKYVFFHSYIIYIIYQI